MTLPAISPLAELDIIEADAQLDPIIQFPHALSEHPLAPRTVFLTGATGFLGAYLLDEILGKTGATVYCLVRASDTAAGNERIAGQLRTYNLWQDSFASRIQPLVGDVSQPFMGLSEKQFLDLAAQTDVIYHSAGWLNMAFPYARLKPVNVTGTLEVLRLAGTISTKPVHFVSSIAVFYTEPNSDAVLLKESDVPQYDASLRGGYSKSKWVADRLVGAAHERGLPTTIHRPVRIMGHSRTGVHDDMNDILPLLLKGCILLGYYPSFDVKVTMAPVDYLSQAMVHLASQKKSWGRAFHFFHPAPIEWRGLMGILQALGYPMEEVPYEQWWRELKRRRSVEESADDKSFLSALILALTAPHFLFYKRPPLDDNNIREGLAGTGISCAPIDRTLIGNYISYWQKSGFLPLP